MAQDTGDKPQRTTVLLSGGSKGIGLEFAKICLRDHRNINLIVGCRSLKRIIQYDTQKSKQDLARDPELCVMHYFH